MPDKHMDIRQMKIKIMLRSLYNLLRSTKAEYVTLKKKTINTYKREVGKHL
jgi:hypothetical protein